MTTSHRFKKFNIFGVVSDYAECGIGSIISAVVIYKNIEENLGEKQAKHMLSYIDNINKLPLKWLT